MSIENLAKNHFTDPEKQQLDAAINTILGIIGQKTYNLSPKERSKYGKVGEQKKLLLTKVKQIHDSQPHLSSPDVDWEEFAADYASRNYAEMKYLELKSALLMILNIKIFHDRDNLIDALRDYQHAAYKNRFGSQFGYSAKVAQLRAFFPKTGKTKKKEDN